MSDGADTFILGYFQGKAARKYFAIKSARAESPEPLASNSFQNLYAGVMGSVRIMGTLVQGGTENTAALLTQVVAGVGSGSAGEALKGDLSTLQGRKLTPLKGWDAKSIKKLFAQYIRFPQPIQGNALDTGTGFRFPICMTGLKLVPSDEVLKKILTAFNPAFFPLFLMDNGGTPDISSPLQWLMGVLLIVAAVIVRSGSDGAPPESSDYEEYDVNLKNFMALRVGNAEALFDEEKSAILALARQTQKYPDYMRKFGITLTDSGEGLFLLRVPVSNDKLLAAFRKMHSNLRLVQVEPDATARSVLEHFVEGKIAFRKKGPERTRDLSRLFGLSLFTAGGVMIIKEQVKILLESDSFLREKASKYAGRPSLRARYQTLLEFVVQLERVFVEATLRGGGEVLSRELTREDQDLRGTLRKILPVGSGGDELRYQLMKFARGHVQMREVHPILRTQDNDMRNRLARAFGSTKLEMDGIVNISLTDLLPVSDKREFEADMGEWKSLLDKLPASEPVSEEGIERRSREIIENIAMRSRDLQSAEFLKSLFADMGPDDFTNVQTKFKLLGKELKLNGKIVTIGAWGGGYPLMGVLLANRQIRAVTLSRQPINKKASKKDRHEIKSAVEHEYDDPRNIHNHFGDNELGGVIFGHYALRGIAELIASEELLWELRNGDPMPLELLEDILAPAVRALGENGSLIIHMKKHSGSGPMGHGSLRWRQRIVNWFEEMGNDERLGLTHDPVLNDPARPKSLSQIFIVGLKVGEPRPFTVRPLLLPEGADGEFARLADEIAASVRKKMPKGGAVLLDGLHHGMRTALAGHVKEKLKPRGKSKWEIIADRTVLDKGIEFAPGTPRMVIRTFGGEQRAREYFEAYAKIQAVRRNLPETMDQYDQQTLPSWREYSLRTLGQVDAAVYAFGEPKEWVLKFRAPAATKKWLGKTVRAVIMALTLSGAVTSGASAQPAKPQAGEAKTLHTTLQFPGLWAKWKEWILTEEIRAWPQGLLNRWSRKGILDTLASWGLPDWASSGILGFAEEFNQFSGPIFLSGILFLTWAGVNLQISLIILGLYDLLLFMVAHLSHDYQGGVYKLNSQGQLDRGRPLDWTFSDFIRLLAVRVLTTSVFIWVLVFQLDDMGIADLLAAAVTSTVAAGLVHGVIGNMVLGTLHIWLPSIVPSSVARWPLGIAVHIKKSRSKAHKKSVKTWANFPDIGIVIAEDLGKVIEKRVLQKYGLHTERNRQAAEAFLEGYLTTMIQPLIDPIRGDFQRDSVLDLKNYMARRLIFLAIENEQSVNLFYPGLIYQVQTNITNQINHHRADFNGEFKHWEERQKSWNDPKTISLEWISLMTHFNPETGVLVPARFNVDQIVTAIELSHIFGIRQDRMARYLAGKSFNRHREQMILKTKDIHNALEHMYQRHLLRDEGVSLIKMLEKDRYFVFKTLKLLLKSGHPVYDLANKILSQNLLYRQRQVNLKKRPQRLQEWDVLTVDEIFLKEENGSKLSRFESFCLWLKENNLINEQTVIADQDLELLMLAVNLSVPEVSEIQEKMESWISKKRNGHRPAGTSSVLDPLLQRLQQRHFKWYAAYTVAGAAIWEEKVFRDFVFDNIFGNISWDTFLYNPEGWGVALGISIFVFSAAHIIIRWIVHAFRTGTPHISFNDRPDFLRLLTVSTALSAVYLLSSLYLPGYEYLFSVAVHAGYNAVVLWARARDDKYLHFLADLPVAAVGVRVSDRLLHGQQGVGKIKEFLRSDPGAWIGFGDLIGVRPLNDAYTKSIVDKMIHASAASAHEVALRHGGLAVHLFGDETAVVLPSNISRWYVHEIGRNIQEAVFRSLDGRYVFGRVEGMPDIRVEGGFKGFYRDEDGIFQISDRLYVRSLEPGTVRLNAPHMALAFTRASPVNDAAGKNNVSQAFGNAENRAELLLRLAKERGAYLDVDSPRLRQEHQKKFAETGPAIRNVPRISSPERNAVLRSAQEAGVSRVYPDQVDSHHPLFKREELHGLLRQVLEAHPQAALMKIELAYLPMPGSEFESNVQEYLRSLNLMPVALRGDAHGYFGLKAINEALGHNTGSAAIRNASESVSLVLPGMHFRESPDVFYAVVPQGKSLQDLKIYANRLSAKISDKIRQGRLSVQAKVRVSLSYISASELQIPAAQVMLTEINRISKAQDPDSMILETMENGNIVKLYDSMRARALAEESAKIRAQARRHAFEKLGLLSIAVAIVGIALALVDYLGLSHQISQVWSGGAQFHELSLQTQGLYAQLLSAQSGLSVSIAPQESLQTLAAGMNGGFLPLSADSAVATPAFAMGAVAVVPTSVSLRTMPLQTLRTQTARVIAQGAMALPDSEKASSSTEDYYRVLRAAGDNAPEALDVETAKYFNGEGGLDQALASAAEGSPMLIVADGDFDRFENLIQSRDVPVAVVTSDGEATDWEKRLKTSVLAGKAIVLKQKKTNSGQYDYAELLEQQEAQLAGQTVILLRNPATNLWSNIEAALGRFEDSGGISSKILGAVAVTLSQ